jgi:hypothetical protein
MNAASRDPVGLQQLNQVYSPQLYVALALTYMNKIVHTHYISHSLRRVAHELSPCSLEPRLEGHQLRISSLSHESTHNQEEVREACGDDDAGDCCDRVDAFGGNVGGLGDCRGFR